MRTEARTVVAITPASTRIPLNRYVLFATLVVAGVGTDLGSKEYVFRTLGVPGRADWDWQLGELVRFVIQTNLNFGALWGIGQGWSGLFAALSLAAVAGVLYFLFYLRHAQSLWLTVALSFVLAGALGNLYDRLGWHGLVGADGKPLYAVRDFLYFRFFETFDWAIFNFADTYLVTGAIMLVIHSFRLDPATALQPIEPTSSQADAATAARTTPLPDSRPTNPARLNSPA